MKSNKASVLVGMSGGIDSAMTAHYLLKNGYRVHGVHFMFFENESGEEDDLRKMTDLANRLGIEFSCYDAREEFRHEVVGYFTSYYTRGLTPSPCVRCNATVKLKLLYDLAEKWGYDYFATGHYIQLLHTEDKVQVQKGMDPKKDQSYYMWMVPQFILKRFITPLGDKKKDDIKKYAIENNFSDLVKKKESAGLCFAQGHSIAELLGEYVPELVKNTSEGIVYNRDGKAIGKHKGYIYYTLGQKSNLDLEVEGKPAVVEIDPNRNALTVDHWDTLYVCEFEIRDALFYDADGIELQQNVRAKIRGLGLNPEGDVTFKKLENGHYQIGLQNPAWAPAPGQPAVFYQDDKVLGGGIIV